MAIYKAKDLKNIETDTETDFENYGNPTLTTTSQLLSRKLAVKRNKLSQTQLMHCLHDVIFNDS